MRGIRGRAIIAFMRRTVLLLIVAVLCLRVWAGEAMAGQMLGQQLAAASQVTMVHGPDCPAAAEDDAPACGSCVHCQDCSLNALPTLPAQAAAPVPPAQAPAHGAGFASADPARALEPPIA